MLAFALLGAEWVLWLLIGLSILCIAVSIERTLFLVRDGTPRAALARAVDGFLQGGDADAFRLSLQRLGGFEARVLDAGMEVARYGPEAVAHAFDGTTSAERLRMERGLAVLGTVGANAPFVGLFGTVLGVIKAFRDMAGDMANASEAVTAGISEALVATAVGLLVAIPAVILYNFFIRWVKGRIGRSSSVNELVLARLVGGAADGR
jgi:biopolymer transport protein ExbB